jgi:hypothetical protein
LPRPSRIILTRHAAGRARRYRITEHDVAATVLEGHAMRRRNRDGDWRVSRAGLLVVYNWPDRGDATAARVVTLWRES